MDRISLNLKHFINTSSFIRMS